MRGGVLEVATIVRLGGEIERRNVSPSHTLKIIELHSGQRTKTIKNLAMRYHDDTKNTRNGASETLTRRRDRAAVEALAYRCAGETTRPVYPIVSAKRTLAWTPDCEPDDSSGDESSDDVSPDNEPMSCRRFVVRFESAPRSLLFATVGQGGPAADPQPITCRRGEVPCTGRPHRKTDGEGMGEGPQ